MPPRPERRRGPVWNPPPTSPSASPGEVQVWRIPLDHDPPFAWSLRATLSEAERNRADRFVFEKDRLRFIVGRGVLREILGRYLRRDPAGLVFEVSAYGKPSLEPGSQTGSSDPLRFNISHSGGLALCAITRRSQIGVDLERLRDDVEIVEIAERFFSRAEVAALRALPAELRGEGFFTCWTRKEAFIKARGEGLSMPLDRFDVSLAPGSRAELLTTRGEAASPAEWTLRALHPKAGYVAAVAVEGRGDFRLRCFDWAPR